MPCLKSKSTNKSGFTLVELLVAIAIMATIMGILLPNLLGARERAVDSQKIQNLTAIKNALRIYYNDHQAYPTPVSVNGTLDSGFSGYISDAGGTDYSYYQTSNGDGFLLCSNLNSAAGADSTNSQTRCGLPVNFPVCSLGANSTGIGVYVECAK